MKKMITTVEVWKEWGMFTAYCPELDVASCGHTPEEAKNNLGEVIVIQLEETTRLGTAKDFLGLFNFSCSVEKHDTNPSNTGTIGLPESVKSVLICG